MNTAAETNDSRGASTSAQTATYAVSSNGLALVSAGGAQIRVRYAISNSPSAFLPTTISDTQPKPCEVQHWRQVEQRTGGLTPPVRFFRKQDY